ncbi:hypothetical protein [Streptomyces sp. bgisy027]|uniref:hypothetical protein n=1 Tax=Streptomyces sp. bgisy027 TaxID=3413770 RepID=UPI003D759586
MTGELYWRVGDAYVQLTDQADRLERIEELRTQLRDAFDPLMRCVRVIVLEGPEIVAQAARGVLEAASETNSALGRVSQDEPQTRVNASTHHRNASGTAWKRSSRQPVRLSAACEQTGCS